MPHVIWSWLDSHVPESLRDEHGSILVLQVALLVWVVLIVWKAQMWWDVIIQSCEGYSVGLDDPSEEYNVFAYIPLGKILWTSIYIFHHG